MNGVLFLAGAVLGLRQETSTLGALLYVPCACCYLTASFFDMLLYLVTRVFLKNTAVRSLNTSSSSGSAAGSITGPFAAQAMAKREGSSARPSAPE